MKKTLNFVFGITFALIMMLSLTGCGSSDKKIMNDAKSSQSQKEDNDWQDINEKNYVAIIKDKTGINLNNLEKFTWKSGYGYSTKVADITGNYNKGTEKAAMFESFIKELLRVSNNSIWSTTVNNDTYRIEKEKEYTTLDSFVEWKKQGDEEYNDIISGGVYIENYSISYTFTKSQLNINIAYYTIS